MMAKKPTGLKGPLSRDKWQSHWSQLFDSGERDAAINAATEAFYLMEHSEKKHDPKVFARSLEWLICEPLTQYLKEIEARKLRGTTEGQRAGFALMQVVYDISEALTSHKLLPARVDFLLAEMLTRWNEFIIAGAAYRMYWDIPHELERKARQGMGGKKGAVQRLKIDPVRLAEKRRSFEANGTAKCEIVGKLALHFKVTESAIRTAEKKAKTK